MKERGEVNRELFNGIDRAKIIEKLIETYSGKSLTEFLTEQPLTTTESYRFDILDVRNEEMIDRRKAPW